MVYSVWQVLFFFFFYSVCGWVAMVAVSSLSYGRFVNFGLLNGPACPSVGVALTLCVWLARDASGNYLWQYLLCVFLSFAVFSFSRRYGRSMTGLSLDGFLLRVCKPFGRWAHPALYLCLGMAAFLVLNLAQPFVLMLAMMPTLLLKITVLVCSGSFVLDLITSNLLLRRLRNRKSRLQREFVKDMDKASLKWGEKLAEKMRRRLYRAYPEMEASAAAAGGLGVPDANRVFAQGMGLTKLFWVFFICALVGDLVETVYCWVVGGHLMSRSSFLYGPFSLVWGGGAMFGVALLEPFAKKNDRWLFFGGFFLGGAYEYLCSVITEALFGKVFWDYSDMPLNIGGRTNVLYMCFWGVAAVVLVKCIYPVLDRTIGKIPPLPGIILTWVLVAVMVLNALVSGLALGRYAARAKNPTAENQLEAFLDVHYPDSLVEARWPNMADNSADTKQ